tara:strand:- start:3855 stop:4226 length:372 start_codon:yes stop_codon:yes gene_type:complete
MKILLALFVIFMTSFTSISANAGAISSAQVIAQHQFEVNKQQILGMVDSDDVQKKLVALGVSVKDAKSRINNLTPNEIMQLNAQINEAPAGSGIVGTVVTVLVVVAVLDLLGVTDAFSFIDPI